MRIATWNINSVRLRLHHVLRFVKEQNIDVLVTMGAGDIGLMIDEIESILKKQC